MDELIVRLYNVHFGDAIFISIPEKKSNGSVQVKHILIDVGNVQGGEGGSDAIFEPVIKDILNILNGKPLDLYVMTHEHLDHVQGLPWYAKNKLSEAELIAKLKVKNAWLPISAKPDYYDTHPDAKKQFELAQKSYIALKALKTTLSPEQAAQLDVLLKNNNRFEPETALNLSPNKTADCVAFLRKLAGAKTHYIHRSVGQPSGAPIFNLSGKHDFKEAVFEIWAPEENSAEYYGRFKPFSFGIDQNGAPMSQMLNALPPQGVDVGTFYNLVKHRTSALYENLLTIDKAANNSSIVFSIEWGGWRLLFPGDAEERSWKEMNKEGVLKALQFLKISHHGSHNGTPQGNILEKILPQSDSNTERHAAVSTFEGPYDGVPHEESLDELEQLGCTIHRTTKVASGKAIEIKLRRKSNT